MLRRPLDDVIRLHKVAPSLPFIELAQFAWDELIAFRESMQAAAATDDAASAPDAALETAESGLPPEESPAISSVSSLGGNPSHALPEPHPT